MQLFFVVSVVAACFGVLFSAVLEHKHLDWENIKPKDVKRPGQNPVQDPVQV